MGIALAPHGYAAIDTATRKRHEFAELVDKLRWRWIQLAPHEPRMPPHQYVDGGNLRPDEVPVARMLEFVIDHHPESYLAYFRGYKRYDRYLEIGDGWRYWRARIGGRSFPHRQRIDATEPPRRLDEGAQPVPPEEWGAKYPYWPQGSGYGEWKKERGEWTFHPEDPPHCRRRDPSFRVASVPSVDAASSLRRTASFVRTGLRIRGCRPARDVVPALRLPGSVGATRSLVRVQHGRSKAAGIEGLDAGAACPSARITRVDSLKSATVDFRQPPFVS